MFDVTPDGKIRIKGAAASTNPSPLKSGFPLSLSGGNVRSMLSEASELAADTLWNGKGGSVFAHAETADRPSPDDVVDCALHALQTAEIDRFHCEGLWSELLQTSHRSAIQFQVILNKLQKSQENFVQVMSDSLKKIVVFESSSLANVQYDIQMLFKVRCRC